MLCFFRKQPAYLKFYWQNIVLGVGCFWVASDCTFSFKNIINPFTLRTPPESIVCYFHTFENNLGIKRKFKKYLKQSCYLTSGQHFSIKYFPQHAFRSKSFTKIVRPDSAALSVNGLIIREEVQAPIIMRPNTYNPEIRDILT